MNAKKPVGAGTPASLQRDDEFERPITPKNNTL